MSIKEQVEFAKEELTQDEKLLAGLIKAERFYKRNRVMIVAVAVILVVGGVGYAVMDYVKEQRLLEANQAYLRLQTDPNDKEAMKRLIKANPKLAALFEVKEAIAKGDESALKRLGKSDDPVVADLAAYHLPALQKSRQGLENYRLRSQALLKDFATLDEAYLLMAKGEMKEAKDRLATIREESPLAPVAKMLSHYGIVPSKGEE